MEGRVVGIYIAPRLGATMESLQRVNAITGRGLEGDRYAKTAGRWSLGREGSRQVTLINHMFFPESGFTHQESRRNLIIEGAELMRFIGEEFKIGQAKFGGVKYCYPCNVPNTLCGKAISFSQAFFDRGGLIADVIEGGEICLNDPLTLCRKND